MSGAHPQRGGSGGRSAPGEMSELADAVLYFVAPGGVSSDRLAAAIDGGVGIVQLRMKDVEAADVLREGERFEKVCTPANVPFIVNDRPDVAFALQADGVHLGQDDVPPAVARAIVGPRAIIGRSTHTRANIDRAAEEHDAGVCDYIAVGPVYATPTKPGRPAVGLDLVAYAAATMTFPWFAIGGIDASNVREVRAAGARRIVVARAIADATDPGVTARELVRRLS